MTSRKNPETPDLPGVTLSGNHKTNGKPAKPIVSLRDRQYKGGRVLSFAVRFRYWRETEGISVAKVAARLEERTREFGIDDRYLLTRLYELEQGRFKPPTWLILLLIETYQIKFPWKEFYE
jgi:hypothetical protein